MFEKKGCAMPMLTKLKLTLPVISLRVSLAVYGFVMAAAPLAIFIFIQQSYLELDNMSVLARTALVTLIVGSIGWWLIFYPWQKLYLSTCSTLKIKAAGNPKLVHGFSIHAFKANLDMISKMAILGHESIKGFRALPAPAVLFDRNGIIISQSAGLSSLLSSEFSKVKSSKGSLFFIGDHISSFLGEEKIQYLQKSQDIPLIIKDTKTVKITATLSRINDGGMRKEAGLILFSVEYKNESAQALQLSTETYVPNHAEELISELKANCITVTNSFAVIADFMRNMAAGNFEHRISLDTKGELGKLVYIENEFAHNLQQLNTVFVPRISRAQLNIEAIHKETDELLTTSALTQQCFAQTYRHFSASKISDTKMAELFSSLNSAVQLMTSETQAVHSALVNTVNQSEKLSHQLGNFHHLVTLVEDLGFHLKLLGLNAVVEAAKYNDNASLHELCKDIRQLGEKFRTIGSQFRTHIEPLAQIAKDSAQNLVIAHNALVQLAPLSQMVCMQIQQQEQMVVSALKPRQEAANTLEQALAHSKAVHENLLTASYQIQSLAIEIKDLFEVANIVLPNVVHSDNQTIILSSHITQRTELAEKSFISLDWFKRDLLLRELSGDPEVAAPEIASDTHINLRRA